jgi:tetratricopeptide (TPR) repeat protein
MARECDRPEGDMRARTRAVGRRRAVWLVRAVLLLGVGPGLGRAEEEPSPNPSRHAAELYDEARKLLEDDTVKAIELLEGSVVEKPTARAYLLLGNAYLRLQRVEEAKKAFGRFLELDPRSSRRDRVKRLLKGLDVSYSARLLLTTEPPGATVYLNFKAAGARGQTPLELPVSAGRHRVFFELAGYNPVVVKDVVIKEKQREAIHRVLVRPGCDVAVAAVPAGVELKVDDEGAVALPATVHVSPGEHMLKLSGTGLVPKTVTVQCEDRRPLEVNETLGRESEQPEALRAAAAVRQEAERAAQREVDRQAQLARQQRIWLRVGIAFGAASVVAQGVALGVHFRAREEEVAGNDFRLLRRIQRGSQGSAIGLAAVAVGSFIAYGVFEHRREALPPAATRPRTGLEDARVGVLLLPGGAGVSYGARF